MRSVRLFTSQPLNAGEELVLEEGAANHLARVLRARVGDRCWLFNGSGSDVEARVLVLGKREVRVLLSNTRVASHPSPLVTHMGLSMSKGDRFDWAVQKATELGVSIITPIASERVELRLNGARLEKKCRHWTGVARSACEQCFRSDVPEIQPPIALDEWVSNVDADLKLVMDQSGAGELMPIQNRESRFSHRPRGWTQQRRGITGRDRGFISWRLGLVMRTETAIAALTALGIRWGDLN